MKSKRKFFIYSSVVEKKNVCKFTIYTSFSKVESYTSKFNFFPDINYNKIKSEHNYSKSIAHRAYGKCFINEEIEHKL